MVEGRGKREADRDQEGPGMPGVPGGPGPGGEVGGQDRGPKGHNPVERRRDRGRTQLVSGWSGYLGSVRECEVD